MSKTSELVNSYVAYRQKRSAIRARQKIELERELEPWLRDFGTAVIKSQEDGKRIEDIEYEIGAKNRTLVYAAKRLAKGLKPQYGTPEWEEPEKPSEPAWELVWGDPRDGEQWIDVRIDKQFSGTAIVDLFDNSVYPPDEWVVDTENQALYREILKEIREKVNT